MCIHAAPGLEERVYDPIEPDRDAQKKDAVWCKGSVHGGVAKECGETAGRGCAVISGLVDAHLFPPFSS
jgi:hypothetical protein